MQNAKRAAQLAQTHSIGVMSVLARAAILLAISVQSNLATSQHDVREGEFGEHAVRVDDSPTHSNRGNDDDEPLREGGGAETHR